MTDKQKEWVNNNREKTRAYQKKYDTLNKEKNKETRKKKDLKRYSEKKEDICKQTKEYYEKNKEQMRLKQKEYYQKNKEKIHANRANRLRTDPVKKLRHNISSLIRHSFKSKGIRKNTKTIKILGCTIDEFKTYLESKFESWMTWDNYGLYNGVEKYGWDIDHIIPQCNGKNETGVIDLNHYTNLQPLCSKVNRDIKRHN